MGPCVRPTIIKAASNIGLLRDLLTTELDLRRWIRCSPSLRRRELIYRSGPYIPEPAKRRDRTPSSCVPHTPDQVKRGRTSQREVPVMHPLATFIGSDRYGGLVHSCPPIAGRHVRTCRRTSQQRSKASWWEQLLGGRTVRDQQFRDVEQVSNRGS